jgi:REP element-mobilizing transposase RayT
MTRSRYRIFETHYPYFLTSTTVAWLPIFNKPAMVEIILDSWRFLQRERDIRILGYVVLENHLHWIAVGDDLENQVAQFKSYTARQIIDSLERTGHPTLLQELSFYKLRHKLDQARQLWQEGSHPQQLSNDKMVWQNLDYMHNNPVRRGYADEPIHWRYSSARNYAGLPGFLDVYMDWT